MRLVEQFALIAGGKTDAHPPQCPIDNSMRLFLNLIFLSGFLVAFNF